MCTHTVAATTRALRHTAETSLSRTRWGRRGEDVLMFCSCPTADRHIKTPRKRQAKSERKRGVAGESERQMDRK